MSWFYFYTYTKFYTYFYIYTKTNLSFFNPVGSTAHVTSFKISHVNAAIPIRERWFSAWIRSRHGARTWRRRGPSFCLQEGICAQHDSINSANVAFTDTCARRDVAETTFVAESASQIPQILRSNRIEEIRGAPGDAFRRPRRLESRSGACDVT